LARAAAALETNQSVALRTWPVKEKGSGGGDMRRVNTLMFFLLGLTIIGLAGGSEHPASSDHVAAGDEDARATACDRNDLEYYLSKHAEMEKCYRDFYSRERKEGAGANRPCLKTDQLYKCRTQFGRNVTCITGMRDLGKGIKKNLHHPSKITCDLYS
jgi:hypothetical protein